MCSSNWKKVLEEGETCIVALLAMEVLIAILPRCLGYFFLHKE